MKGLPSRKASRNGIGSVDGEKLKYIYDYLRESGMSDDEVLPYLHRIIERTGLNPYYFGEDGYGFNGYDDIVGNQFLEDDEYDVIDGQLDDVISSWRSGDYVSDELDDDYRQQLSDRLSSLGSEYAFGGRMYDDGGWVERYLQSWLWPAENSVGAGFDKRTGLWYPHLDPGNGKRNIGPGLNENTHSRDFRYSSRKGYTKDEIDRVARKDIHGRINEIKSGLEDMGYAGLWDRLSDGEKAVLVDIHYNTGKGPKYWPQLVDSMSRGDVDTALNNMRSGDDRRRNIRQNMMLAFDGDFSEADIDRPSDWEKARRAAAASEADFIDRMRRRDIRFVWNPDGTYSTHRLSFVTDDDGAVVYPEVQDIGGELVDTSYPPYDSYRSARAGGDTVRFASPQLARLYTEGFEQEYPDYFDEVAKSAGTTYDIIGNSLLSRLHAEGGLLRNVYENGTDNLQFGIDPSSTFPTPAGMTMMNINRIKALGKDNTPPAVSTVQVKTGNHYPAGVLAPEYQKQTPEPVTMMQKDAASLAPGYQIPLTIDKEDYLRRVDSRKTPYELNEEFVTRAAGQGDASQAIADAVGRLQSGEGLKDFQRELFSKGYYGDSVSVPELTMANGSDEAYALQRKLKEAGYDIGTFGTDKSGIDGRIGAKTRAAWAQYVKDHPDQAMADAAADGIMGPATRAAAKRYYEDMAAGSVAPVAQEPTNSRVAASAAPSIAPQPERTTDRLPDMNMSLDEAQALYQYAGRNSVVDSAVPLLNHLIPGTKKARMSGRTKDQLAVLLEYNKDRINTVDDLTRLGDYGSKERLSRLTPLGYKDEAVLASQGELGVNESTVTNNGLRNVLGAFGTVKDRDGNILVNDDYDNEVFRVSKAVVDNNPELKEKLHVFNNSKEPDTYIVGREDFDTLKEAGLLGKGRRRLASDLINDFVFGKTSYPEYSVPERLRRYGENAIVRTGKSTKFDISMSEKERQKRINRLRRKAGYTTGD